MSARLTGCPGAGAMPASDSRPWPDDRRPCPRCGGLYALRADGRIRAHRVKPSAIVPMIRGVRYTSGVIRAERT